MLGTIPQPSCPWVGSGERKGFWGWGEEALGEEVRQGDPGGRDALKTVLCMAPLSPGSPPTHTGQAHDCFQQGCRLWWDSNPGPLGPRTQAIPRPRLPPVSREDQQRTWEKAGEEGEGRVERGAAAAAARYFSAP